MAKTIIEYPKYMFGPNGEARVFERPEDIPEGWRETINEVADKKPASKSVSKGSKQAKVVSFDEESEISTEDMFEHLKSKGMSELWKMAKELGIDKSGKKPELIERIVAKLQSVQ